MKRLFIALLTALTLFLPGIATAATWHIDPDHSTIGFQVRKLMFTVNGDFARYTSDFEIQEKDLTSSRASVTIDVASIDTHDAKRDEHLRSPDYFDVARYPTMTFVTTKVLRSADRHFLVIGDLALHGVTREVALEVENLSPPTTDRSGHLRRHATATTEINRKDYNLKWNSLIEGGGMVVGNKVKIILDIEMVKV